MYLCWYHYQHRSQHIPKLAFDVNGNAYLFQESRWHLCWFYCQHRSQHIPKLAFDGNGTPSPPIRSQTDDKAQPKPPIVLPSSFMAVSNISNGNVYVALELWGTQMLRGQQEEFVYRYLWLLSVLTLSWDPILCLLNAGNTSVLKLQNLLYM